MPNACGDCIRSHFCEAANESDGFEYCQYCPLKVEDKLNKTELDIVKENGRY